MFFFSSFYLLFISLFQLLFLAPFFERKYYCKNLNIKTNQIRQKIIPEKHLFIFMLFRFKLMMQKTFRFFCNAWRSQGTLQYFCNLWRSQGLHITIILQSLTFSRYFAFVMKKDLGDVILVTFWPYERCFLQYSS